MRNNYKIIVGKSQGKCSLGRSNGRWEDNITIKDTACEGVDPIQLPHDTVQ